MSPCASLPRFEVVDQLTVRYTWDEPNPFFLPNLAARKHPEVVGAAPFINTQALIARGEDMKGTLVRGIDPKLEPEVTDINGIASKGTFDKLVPGQFGIVLGAELARSLFVQPGDQVTLVAPGGQEIGRAHV